MISWKHAMRGGPDSRQGWSEKLGHCLLRKRVSRSYPARPRRLPAGPSTKTAPSLDLLRDGRRSAVLAVILHWQCSKPAKSSSHGRHGNGEPDVGASCSSPGYSRCVPLLWPVRPDGRPPPTAACDMQSTLSSIADGLRRTNKTHHRRCMSHEAMGEHARWRVQHISPEHR